MTKKIIIKALVSASLEKAWDAWTKPDHIVKWNFATDDWQSILNNFKKYVEAY